MNALPVTTSPVSSRLHCWSSSVRRDTIPSLCKACYYCHREVVCPSACLSIRLSVHNVKSYSWSGCLVFFMENPLHSCGASPVIKDFTWHPTQVNTPCLIFSHARYPREMKDWVDLGISWNLWRFLLIYSKPCLKSSNNSKIAYSYSAEYLASFCILIAKMCINAAHYTDHGEQGLMWFTSGTYWRRGTKQKGAIAPPPKF